MKFLSLVFKSFANKKISYARILWQNWAVQIGADAVVILNAFGKILAVVAGAANDGTKSDAFVSEESLAGVILVADNFAKFWCIDDDITDETLVFPLGVKVKNASALNLLPRICLELVA